MVISEDKGNCFLFICLKLLGQITDPDMC